MPRSIRSCNFSRPSRPMILRTLMAPVSCGQSFRMLFRSRLIPDLMIGHLLFNCQSRRRRQRRLGADFCRGSRVGCNVFCGGSRVGCKSIANTQATRLPLQGKRFCDTPATTATLDQSKQFRLGTATVLVSRPIQPELDCHGHIPTFLRNFRRCAKYGRRIQVARVVPC